MQIKKFKYLLVAVQYVDFFRSAQKGIRDELPGDVSKSPINLSPRFDIQLIAQQHKDSANVLVDPMRIQYEKREVQDEDIEKINDIIKDLRSQRNNMVPEREKDNIEFSGAIIEAEYELEEKELSSVCKRFFKKGIGEEKRVDLRLNYSDSDNLNYNVSFIIDIKSKELNVRFDINDRYCKEHNKEIIETLLNKIIKELKDEKKLFNSFLNKQE